MNTMQKQIADSVVRSRAEGRELSAGSVKDEEIYRLLMRDAPLRAGGISFSRVLAMNNSLDLCRFPIAGSRGSMVICGKPIERASYCQECYERAHLTTRQRTDRHSISICQAETRPAPEEKAAVEDLFGEVVA